MIINPPKNITVCRNNASASVTPIVSTLSVGEIAYTREGYLAIANLEDALTLLQKDYPFSEHWQKFTETGTFTVPDGVTEILVMCIAAGASSYAATDDGGSVLVSRYFTVTPGSQATAKVGVPDAVGSMPRQLVTQFTFGSTNNLRASYMGHYAVDSGTSNRVYTTGQSPVFPADLNSKNMCTIGRLSDRIATSDPTNAGPGTGGYAIPLDAPDERAAWLAVARDMPPGTMNNGQLCWPDTTQKGGDAVGTKAGAGGGYGGAAGKFPAGAAEAENGALGGPGLVCVFWGPDIHKPSA